MGAWRAYLVVLWMVTSIVWPSLSRAEECTWNGEWGQLVPAGQPCEHAWKQTENEVTDIVRSTAVCCPVFRNEPECGKISLYDGTFSHDSREAQLDQFPWAVVISYRWISTTVCSGSLITREFVLSAAHCFVKRHRSLLPSQYRVRLGDWELTMDTDCRYVNGYEICNKPSPVTIPVRKIVNHRLYEAKRGDFLHDIALLRLERPVDYTDLISPICLPDWSTQPPDIAGRNFTATGWGKTRSFSSLRRKLKIPMVGRNISLCSRVYSMSTPEVSQVQLCVGGIRRRDVCFGDSGGALMRREDNHWTQVGIISFGTVSCNEGAPGVYTNVAYYMDWIQSVILHETG